MSIFSRLIPRLSRTVWNGRYWLSVLLLLGTLSGNAQNPSLEYQLKAVFLFNFTQFVDWPAESFPDDQSPLVIGIIGENPFGNYLEQAVSGETKNGHPVIVQYYQDEDSAKSCHMLFINLPESDKRKQVIEKIKEEPVLTVSDASDFFVQGGLVRFVKKNNKIRLQINLEACKELGIVPSSKLLQLADIIEPDKTN